MSVSQFNLPDVGEGLTEADIVSWKVKPGDEVKVNDIVVEIETAKSLVELPCPFAGVVDSLLVEEGQTVPVGTPIIAVRTAADTGGRDVTDVDGVDHIDETPADSNGDTGQATDASEERQPVLVGYGPRASSPKRRARKSTRTPAAGTAAAPDAGATRGTTPGTTAHAGADADAGTTATTDAAARAGTAGGPAASTRPGTSGRVLAKPPVRKLAKDLGVDLSTVTPTGPNGTVTRDDVHAAAAAAASTDTGADTATAPSGDGWHGQPREERIPIRSVRRKTAEAMVNSAFTAPHVTEFITVDVTRTVKLTERLRTTREFRDIKLSPLALVARAMCMAIPRTPEVNARWDGEAGEIVMQRYVNLGIAAATPRGLVVPNIKDAHRMSLRELAVAINELASTAREGTTPPADMQGGTISITNVGVFGVDTGTPILNPGEAAILAFGAVRQQPWVHKGKVKPRWITTLGLSFDHRLVDGEQGSRFISDLAALLEDPAQALAWA